MSDTPLVDRGISQSEVQASTSKAPIISQSTQLGKAEQVLIDRVSGNGNTDKALTDIVSLEPSSPEIKKVISEAELRTRIGKQIGDLVLTPELLEQKDQRLASMPQLGRSLTEAWFWGKRTAPVFGWAQTDKIVGASLKKIEGWAYESDDRKGRINEIAGDLVEGKGDPKTLEHVFHAQKQHERIRLTAIDGPSGPIYAVDDGTHRVSASKLIGLDEIPADISVMQYPVEISTDIDDIRLSDWQRKIELGLIDGVIEDFKDSNGQQGKRLTVKSEVLPWIRASVDDIAEVSTVYETLYPGSLDNLPIPKQALLDPVANSFYMNGKWDQWLQQHPTASQ